MRQPNFAFFTSFLFLVLLCEICCSINGEDNASSLANNINSPSSANHHQYFNLKSALELISSLRGAVTPSLLIIIAYIISSQYLTPFVSSFIGSREVVLVSSSMMTPQQSRSKRHHAKNGGKFRASASVADVSTQSSSAGTPNPRGPSLKSLESQMSEIETDHSGNGERPSLTYGGPARRTSEMFHPSNYEGSGDEGIETTSKMITVQKNTRKSTSQSSPTHTTKTNEIKSIAGDMLFRDQWLALIDSKNVPFLQILIQLESGRSAVLNSIKEYVSCTNGGLKAVIKLILQEQRPVEAAGLLRLLVPDEFDSELKQESEHEGMMILVQLIKSSPSDLSKGLKLLFDRNLLHSPPLTFNVGIDLLSLSFCVSEMICLVLDTLISRRTEGLSEDFQTTKSLIPTPVSPDISHRMFQIVLNNPKSSHDAVDVASSTAWEMKGGDVALHYLCDIWKSGSSEFCNILIEVLKDIKEKYSKWFDAECPKEINEIIKDEIQSQIRPLSPSILYDQKWKNEITGGSLNHTGINFLDVVKLGPTNDFQSLIEVDTIDSPNWRFRIHEDESIATPLFSNNAAAVLLSPVGQLLSPEPQLDLSRLFEGRDICMEMIGQCERRADRSCALTALEALEEKVDNQEIRRLSYGDTALKGLLKIFVDGDDLRNAERVLSNLEKLNMVDCPCYAIMMQMCCRLGNIVKAQLFMEKIFDCCSNDTSSILQLNQSCVNSSALIFGDWPLQSPLCLNKALRTYVTALIDSRQCDRALDYLMEVVEEHRLPVDSFTITHLFLKLLKSQPERRLASRLLYILLSHIDIKNNKDAQKLQNSVRVDEAFFTVVADCCIKFRNDELLTPIIERYKQEWRSQFTPDVQTCGVLIKALGTCGRIEDCRWMFWHVTEAQGVEPSEVTYGCMLDALVNNSKVDEAVALFEDMKTKGKVRPNTIMYSTIVKGYAQEKQLDRALAIHEEMRSKGVPINTVTYNTLVDACARVGAMDKAAALLEDMLSSGVEPDLITFSTIAKGYCVQGDVQRAMQLLAAMKDRGIRPDGILYNSLLDGCVRALRPDLCEQVWQQMQSSGIPPSNFTLTILIKMFGRAGKLSRAFEAVRQLPKRYGFNINAHVYTCLMSACIANKEFAKALEVFECMRKDEVSADAKTFETVLFGTTRWGNFPEALKIVRSAFCLDRSYHERRNSKVVGFSMDTRNFRNLWNAMREAGDFQLALPVIEELFSTYGSAVYRYVPSGYVPQYNQTADVRHASTIYDRRRQPNDAETSEQFRGQRHHKQWSKNDIWPNECS